MKRPEIINVPILIIGAGPVGLALAADLGWRGKACLVVEQTDGSIYQPRQDMIGIRTMEFCRRWGIVADVEASPYPRDYPQDNVYIAGSLVTGWEIGRYPSPSMVDAHPPPQSPQIRERCPQNMFDPILVKFAHSFDDVDIRYRHRFLDFEADDDGVTAEIEDLDFGGRKLVRARFLVGCDGANSQVRDAMGVTMLGDPELTYTTNIIFRYEGFEGLHNKKPGYRFILLDQNGTWSTIVAINGRDQWRMSIIGNRQDRRELTNIEIKEAIRSAVGCDFNHEILSVVQWVRRELVAEKFSIGNVLIAGDAAHCMSPTGGFGMNTGIGDAIDLSWKLSAVLDGWGGESLTRSYDAERRPVAITNVAEASGNLTRMLSPGPNPYLLERSTQGEKTREFVGDNFSETMQREWNTLGIHLGYSYEKSPIICPDGSPQLPYSTMTYTQTSRPGARAPHVALSGESSSLDLFGQGYVLLHLGSSVFDFAPFTAAAARRGLPLDVLKINDPIMRMAYERDLVLVRPDGHVAWRGDAIPVDMLAVVDRVRGA